MNKATNVLTIAMLILPECNQKVGWTIFSAERLDSFINSNREHDSDSNNTHRIVYLHYRESAFDFPNYALNGKR